MASLEQYLASNDPGISLNERVELARTRAISMTGINVALSLPNLSGSISDLQTRIETTDSGGINGKLSFGRWRHSQPGDQDYNGCWIQKQEPCFDPADFDSEVSPIITAAHLALRTNPNTAIQMFFGGFLGAGNFIVSAEAHCTIAPRHLVTLIDLSRSIYADSHPPSEAKPQRPSEYVFYLGGASRIPQLNSENRWCDASYDNNDSNDGHNPLYEPIPDLDGDGKPDSYNLLVNNNESAATCARPLYWPASQSTDYLENCLPQKIYDDLDVTRSGGSITTDHYQSDYSCYESYGRSCKSYRHTKNCMEACKNAADPFACYLNYGNGHPCSLPNCENTGGGFLVDSVSRQLASGPQPLYSIFSGVNSLLKIFEGRAVVGDKMGLLGFATTSFSPQRMYDLSPPGSKTFEDMKSLTNVESSEGPWHIARKEEFKRLFFPITQLDSNIELALRTAFVMLYEAQLNGEAQASVVLVSDLLGNCVTKNENNSQAAPTSDCGGSVSYYNESTSKIEGIIRDYYIPAKVGLSVAAIGSAVGPHTVLRKGRDGCMDSKEAQTLSQSGLTNPSVEGNEGEGFNGRFESPFFKPNEIYEKAVLPSKGLWMPLRPSCCEYYGGLDECNRTSQPIANLRSELNAACNDDRLQIGDPVSDVEGPDSIVEALRSNLSNNFGFNANEVVDSAGRLLCDPQGRSISEQMSEYMETLMQDNPIVLIGP
ncbi:MAG: hypothetical protein DCC75_10630 [Proteobacteria bacterium]|nr:MAG: hypothetical protein DCC75_10630 [Pseudomonadota bacterium]